MKEAYYYIKTSDALRCLLCPKQCKLKNGETGKCHTRINIENTLFTKAYGNPCAVNIDPIEKKPLFHFFPSAKVFSIATAGCNMTCLNCQNWEISQECPENINSFDMMPENVVENAVKAGTKIIAYTYTEPISFYEYTFETSLIAKKNGIKNVLITNGYINEKPLRDIAKYIDAANVNLKSFSNDIYKKLNGATLKPVLNTLKILKEENVWMEITNLLIPGWTDNPDMIKQMCDWLFDNGLADCPLHFSKFHPTFKLNNIIPTPFNILELARNIALNSGIKYVYIGNITGSDYENTICHNCNKTLIERVQYSVKLKNINDGICAYCGYSIPGVWK